MAARLASAVAAFVLTARLLWDLAAPPADHLLTALASGRGAHLMLTSVAAGSAGVVALTAYAAIALIAAATVLRELCLRLAPSVASAIPVVGPAALRRTTLALCGLGLAASSTATSAVAGDTTGVPPSTTWQAIVGLQLPDLPLGGTRLPDAAPHLVVVRPGDSLWRISERLLGGEADVGRIAAATHALYASNKASVGPDPNLIHPGTTLTVPEDIHDVS